MAKLPTYEELGKKIAEEALDGYIINGKTLREWVDILAQTGWIPVTEDAPQKGTICLWCNKQGSVFISAITYRSESSSYVGKHGYFSNGLENYGDIVAWMPLPEPYKAESEDKE